MTNRPSFPRRALLLAVLFSGILHADEAKRPAWFSGMLHPPAIIPALPNDFIVVSLSPETKTTGKFDMYRGVLWAPERTARRHEFGASLKISEAEDPLFYVRLSQEVMQKDKGPNFSNEPTLEKSSQAMGIKDIRISKIRWGNYPVLTMTGQRPDGSLLRVAWLGTNVPEGWTLFIDYRIPRGDGHPTPEELKLWDRLIAETKAAAE